MKFRKKPVVIDAWRYVGTKVEGLREPMDVTLSMLSDLGCPVEPAGWGEDDNLTLLIDTLEGKMQCPVGNIVIKGVKGEYYSCAPDVFEQSYEAAEDE